MPSSAQAHAANGPSSAPRRRSPSRQGNGVVRKTSSPPARRRSAAPARRHQTRRRATLVAMDPSWTESPFSTSGSILHGRTTRAPPGGANRPGRAAAPRSGSSHATRAVLVSRSVSSRRLPLLLALCVAIFAGLVPLRECLAADTGDQGVVALGTHAHRHVVHDHDAHGRDAHEPCEGVRGETDAGDVCTAHCHEADHDGSHCCIDAPFAVCARFDAISADRGALDPHAVVAACVGAFLSLADESLDAPIASAARTPAPPTVRLAVPTGVRSVVLLR